MLFNTLGFGVFLAVVLVASAALRRRLVARDAFLLAASYFFYGCWDWRFLGLIAFSTVIDFVAGAWLDKRTASDADAFALSAGHRRALLALSIVVNLGVLGVFKYLGFFVESAAGLLATVGIDAHLPTLDLVLPVGISFYTFQSMSYTLDIHRGRLRAERSLLRFALFVAFFPQLVAGPIVRAREFLPQLRRVCQPTREQIESGAWLVYWGLFKKVFVADNLARVAEMGFDDPNANGGIALAGVYAFAMQIYCDFSGYTDIARGTARLIGFELPLNFDMPYLAQGPREFWRRWHISLSTWLRDYLYIPLGGSRGGAARTSRALFLTMLLGGLWHGAAWTFVAWGAFHGALLIAGRWVFAAEQPERRGPAAWWRRIGFFHVTCIGWVLFRADTLVDAGRVFGRIARDLSMAGARFDSVLFYSAPVLLVWWLQSRANDERSVARIAWPIRGVAFAAMWFLMTLLGEFDGDAFIYFQF